MIVRPRPNVLALFFVLRGSIVPTIAPKILAVALLAAAVVGWHRLAPQHFVDLSPVPLTLIGLALSIFLGFRNNACYERWWEARRQWGQLIAESRGLMRDARALFPDTEAHERLGRRVIAFAHALAAQLRATPVPLDPWLEGDELLRATAARSAPDVVLGAALAELGQLRRDGIISDILYQLMSLRLQALTTIQTACERIKSTPTPFTYGLLLHRTAWLFCLLLPFGLASSTGLAAPLVTAILGYAFLGLDALGDELEEPFGLNPNAVPLAALVRSVEIAVLEALGEDFVPAPLQPDRYVLL